MSTNIKNGVARSHWREKKHPAIERIFPKKFYNLTSAAILHVNWKVKDTFDDRQQKGLYVAVNPVIFQKLLFRDETS